MAAEIERTLRQNAGLIADRMLDEGTAAGADDAASGDTG